MYVTLLMYTFMHVVCSIVIFIQSLSCLELNSGREIITTWVYFLNTIMVGGTFAVKRSASLPHKKHRDAFIPRLACTVGVSIRMLSSEEK